MNINEIYRRKNNKPYEFYRNMISIYYFLLINNKLNDYPRYLIQFKIKYINFFRNNFINNNIFFFTLYNKIPNIFLPLPYKYYFKYPIITFSNKIKGKNYKIKLDLPKNNKLLNTNYYYSPIEVMFMSNFDYVNSLKYVEHNIYDFFNIINPIEYLNKLNSNFLRNKTYFIIYNNNVIIANNIKINNNIIIEKYFVKSGKKFNFESNKLELKLSDILYLSILDDITNNKVLQVFPLKTIPKDTILYNQINKNNKYFDYHTKSEWIPSYFTLTKTRILDPLYGNLEEKYYIKQFKVKQDFEILDITTNIYLDNEIVRNYYNISKDYKVNCLEIDINSKKLCEYDIYKPEKNNFKVNYNKKIGLTLLIWKNFKNMDYNITFFYFINDLKIKNYFNIFSTIITKDNQQKLLGEELFITDKNILNKIESIDEYKPIDLSLK
jgi:hypothetical protein